MLTLFLCRVFIDNPSISLEYPKLEHPLGQSIRHHHSHSAHLSQAIEKNIPFKLLQLSDEQAGASAEVLEHEHGTHGHSLYYPGEDFVFAVDFPPSDVAETPDICYQACRYAPPHPPPTDTGQALI
ncbi:hypothetical protein [Thalassomonas haliotis]|uniref:Uncharacterized protein n=1 Tax=Thalassomonas haliotis TaxID=485448 RepID=A0ABY7VB44_9GAMM|nr:hypothetical protein [Thalassomonas haliotis]WDE10107.1 hypothetical protein H3N35_17660 [Thalassomonas haliotis]